MGVKDAYQFDYLDDNQRFADQVNGALFGGRQVVRNMLQRALRITSSGDRRKRSMKDREI